jgi:adenosine deaminase
MEYFEQIRKDSKALETFFSNMPKGADIHHHALGALWAEDIMEMAEALDLWVNKDGFLNKNEFSGAQKFRKIIEQDAYQKLLFQKWSVHNFDHESNNSHVHFFDVFAKIAPVFIGHESFWLSKIAQNAKEENINYVETLIECPSSSEAIWKIALDYPYAISEKPDFKDFQRFYAYLEKNGLHYQVDNVLESVENWSAAANSIDGVRIAFQLYTVRMLDPRQVLAQLILSYEAANRSDKIAGVNLVAPEHHDLTLRFYEMQMLVCSWLGEKFPDVNLALHAGELDLSLVAEKHLENHISQAVFKTNVKRIGHGVDLLYESDSKDILEKMSNEKIAIEILQSSNQFILGVDASRHPFSSYYEAGVPIVISTDDPGILRCRLADEFCTLAKNYSFLQYNDFKNFAKNSILFSFLEQKEKAVQLKKLENKLIHFENQYI